MRRLLLASLLLASANGLAAPKLSRELARKRIYELSSSKLLPAAIEIREIQPEPSNQATVESTITVALQFKKTSGGVWTVDSIRLGDADWLNMNELLGAIYHGRPAELTAPPPLPQLKPLTPVEGLHVNQNDFEKERGRMLELGESPLIPGSIEIRRVISQSETRTIAEATVTMVFRFVYNARSKRWTIEAARLGDREWINTVDLTATLNETRRRQTVSMMEELASAIEKYRMSKGSLPPAKDIGTLVDILYPDYMKDLVRFDGWGQEIQYSISGATFRLRSRGLDGMFYTDDDVVVTAGTPSRP